MTRDHGMREAGEGPPECKPCGGLGALPFTGTCAACYGSGYAQEDAAPADQAEAA